MPKKKYRVVDGPLSVRRVPGGQWLKSYPTGHEFIANTDTQQTLNGYVWIQHDEGWSAKRSEDKSKRFLQKVEEVTTPQDPEPPTNEPEILKMKTNRQVRVRKSPTLSAEDIRWLAKDEIIETQSDSRTERDGYVWWQHKDGWSASQSLDGRWVFMDKVVESEPKEDPPVTPDPDPPVQPPAIPKPTVLKLQATTDVRIRSEADLSGTFIKWMPAGTIVECNASSEVTNDGYVWLHHKDGWSAWKNVSGSVVFLDEPGSVEGLVLMTPDGPVVSTLPSLKTLVQRLPVDINNTHWWQYFGNNVYAVGYGVSWGYDRYAQGLHSGLDFGNNNAGIPVYAGLSGKFKRNDRFGVRVTSGPYTVIYQHLTHVPNFNVGDPISVNTKLGELDPAANLRHLHFEIRYKGAWIVNPLLFISDEMFNQITNKFNPSHPRYFYRSGAWDKWLTPLDQPVIKLGGPVIGPTAG
jgi:hypothetical protein